MVIASITTPGVYIEEKALLPPSVAEVATAIPAFIGYTEIFKGPDPVIAEITSLRDFESRYGKAPATPYEVRLDANDNPQLYLPGASTGETPSSGILAPVNVRPQWLLWYSLDLYFRNGGGRCYVVSVGEAKEGATLKANDLINGLAALQTKDEPTLIVIPEATQLQSGDFTTVSKECLQHCGKMQDRFAILDLKEKQDLAPISTPTDLETARKSFGSDDLAYGAAYYPFLETSLPNLFDEAQVVVTTPGKDNTPPTTENLDTLKVNKTDLYNKIKRLLGDQRVILPPSPAMAGAYVRVDRERGVWKAPANIGLQAVIKPVDLMTDDQQGSFNDDPDTGKSINAIRSFAGRGPVVWGARTLKGNDNEWRYIPVRRLFITIEESVKKATYFAVFEPNDASTWLKVKGMIESYLYSLWEQGALQGSKPEQAFFVNVGLGKTMTAKDILNGWLIVEIGIAAVRPAEFILLTFSHRMAQA